tara:strand:- start:7572 stop:7937 length:366 start_codon:yes stop_codon:yes gene_type:complete
MMLSAFAVVAARDESKTTTAPQRIAAAQKWVGLYDGGQMELAAQLELRADGHFSFALSYGALDEAAEGRWQISGDGIQLTPERYISNDPNNRDQQFGYSTLTIAGESLTLSRYGLSLQFTR